jgi:hypothetical protein
MKDRWLDAFHRADLPAHVAQTGGGCTAIHVPIDGDGLAVVTVADDASAPTHEDAETFVAVYPSEDAVYAGEPTASSFAQGIPGTVGTVVRLLRE